MWCWRGIKFLKRGSLRRDWLLSSCRENIFFQATKIFHDVLCVSLQDQFLQLLQERPAQQRSVGEQEKPGQNCIDHRVPSSFTSNCLFPRQRVFAHIPTNLLISIRLHKSHESLMFHLRYLKVIFRSDSTTLRSYQVYSSILSHSTPYISISPENIIKFSTNPMASYAPTGP